MDIEELIRQYETNHTFFSTASYDEIMAFFDNLNNKQSRKSECKEASKTMENVYSVLKT